MENVLGKYEYFINVLEYKYRVLLVISTEYIPVLENVYLSTGVHWAQPCYQHLLNS